MTCLPPTDLERGRARLYGLVGRLWVDGVVPVRQLVAAIPALEEAWPDGSEEEAQADHYALTGQWCTPYAGFFLHVDRREGAEEAARAQHTWQRIGLPDRPDVPADHIGRAWTALAWLGGARVDALEDGQVEVASSIQDLQRAVLAEHILGWLAPLSVVLSAVPGRLSGYAIAHRLAVEAAVDHGREVGVVAPRGPAARVEVLSDPATDLARVAEALAAPAYAGVVWSVAELQGIARSTEVPHAFGGRRQVLETMLKAAVDHRRVGQVVEALTVRLDRAQRLYEDLGEEGLWAAPWLERLAVTRGELAALAAAAAP